MKNKRFVNLFILLIFCSCGNDKTDVVKKVESEKDTVITEVVPEEKPVGKKKVSKEAMAEELKPIRDNFNRINAIEKWTSTVKKDFGETTEGGEADYCYLDGKLEKIVYRQFGETFQKLSEFYLLDGKLSFAFEQISEYNRPIYWDSTAMKENGDNQVWDAEKSEITEKRNFFQQGKLIHQLQYEGQEKASAITLMTEEKRIQREFDKLLPAPVQEIKPTVK